MITTIHYSILKIDCELDVDIYLLNSRIFTTDDLNVFSDSHKNEEKGNFLVIGIEQEIAEYESLFDVIPYTRPRLLILLGIFSFFTQELFTPFDVFTSLTKTIEVQEYECKKFTIKDKDMLPEINLLIEFLNQAEPRMVHLFYSLIDRWRKALYLEFESEDKEFTMMKSYFHIFIFWNYFLLIIILKNRKLK